MTQRQYLGVSALAGLLFLLAGPVLAQEKPSDEAQLKTLVTRARRLVQQGHYQEAIPDARRIARLVARVYGKDTVEMGAALNNLGTLYYRTGQYAEAEEALRRCLKVREIRPGPDHLETAYSLNTLAAVYLDTARYEQAEKRFRRSLAIYEKRLGPTHAATAAALNNLAYLFLKTGQYAQAEPLFQRALRIKEKTLGPNDASLATGLHNLAELYRRMQRFDRAEELHERSLKIHEKRFGPEHPETAICLNQFAELYLDRGEFGKAEALYRRALTITEKRFGADSLEVSALLTRVAMLAEKMGQYPRATELFRRALAITEAQRGRDHLDTAACLQNLAEMYRAQQDFARAEPLYQRCLTIKEKQRGPVHEDVALSLNGLGALYREMGAYARAEPLLRRALQITEKNRGADHPDTAMRLNSLAVLYQSKGEYARAEPLYRRSLKIIEEKLAHDPLQQADSWHNLAELLAAQGKWKETLVLTSRARRLSRSFVERVLPTMGDLEQLAFLWFHDRLNYECSLSLGLRSGRPDGAAQSAEWVLNGKAVTQEALAQRAVLAREAADPKLAPLAREVRALRQQIAAATFAPYRSVQEKARTERLARLTRRERDLAGELSRLARRKPSGHWTTLDQVRAALPQGSVLIEVARFPVMNYRARDRRKMWQPARYAAWVIPPPNQGEVKLVDLGDAVQIEEALAPLRQHLHEAPAALPKQGEPTVEKAWRDATRPLQRLILRPLLPHIGKASHWIISPDAVLWLVPWHALTLPDGSYTLEKYRIHFVVSGRDLTTRPVPPSSGAAVVLADPDYDLGREAADRAARRLLTSQEELRGFSRFSAALGNVRWQRLPGTAVEAKTIVARLKASTRQAPVVRMGKEALESAVKTARRPRILVFCTHGFFLEDQEGAVPAPSLLADRGLKLVAAKAARRREQAALPLENPLLRCGLVLAGANHRPATLASKALDDGLLTGLEIVGLDLHGTELVVLSACETGVGLVSIGEGVIGLRQAFQLAGAQSVLATLWRIPDRETARLMGDFFDHFTGGKSKVEALRAAQLGWIKQRRAQTGAAHPFYWAAFTLTGQGQ